MTPLDFLVWAVLLPVIGGAVLGFVLVWLLTRGDRRG